jgi:hypothetical protein
VTAAARDAHRAYWHAQGLNPAEITTQWEGCAHHAAWEAVVTAVVPPSKVRVADRLAGGRMEIEGLRAEVAKWRSAAEVAQESADAIRKQLARATEAGDARGLKTTLRKVLASFDADTDGTQSANVTQAEFEAWAGQGREPQS